MKNLTLRTLLVILILTAFMMSNAVALAADSQTGTTKQKKKEEIKPLSGEKWYEEGDEELYKFDIHPVTPKKGITGGILIYYGHFVKPPYKVERKGLEIFINGLCVHPGHDAFEKKLSKIKTKRMLKDFQMTSELDKFYTATKQISADVHKHYESIVKKYGYSKETLPERRKALKEFVSKHPLVSECKGYDAGLPQVSYKVKGTNRWFGIGIETGMETIPKKVIQKRKLDDIVFETNYWEKRLKKNMIIFHSTQTEYSESLKDLTKIKKIILTKTLNINRVKEIFKLVREIDNSKGIAFNFDIEKIQRWESRNESK